MAGRRLRPAVVGAAGMVLFLLAVHVLGTVVEGMAPAAGGMLPRLVAHPASALGAGWTLTYLFLNGSVVAALAVTFAAGGILDAETTFLVVAGSRLGAASFVILVGLLDYRRAAGLGSLRGALGLGLLTFVVTHTVYLPAAGLGLVAVDAFPGALARLSATLVPPLPSPEFLTPGVRAVLRATGPVPVFLLALLLLVAAVRLADAALRSVDRERLRTRYLSRLGNRWISFGAGLTLTLLTASVAFSVGILVPLYNRGHIRRGEVVPYLLGANLGTLADTYLVALVLRTATGGQAVLALILAASAVTGAALAGYPGYRRVVERSVDAIVATRRTVMLFGVMLLAAPLLLWALPLL